MTHAGKLNRKSVTATQYRNFDYLIVRHPFNWVSKALFVTALVSRFNACDWLEISRHFPNQ